MRLHAYIVIGLLALSGCAAPQTKVGNEPTPAKAETTDAETETSALRTADRAKKENRADPQSQSPERVDASRQWRLVYHMSGGFAGVRRTLIVSSNGHLEAIDEKHAKRYKRKVGSREMDEINGLLATLDFSQLHNGQRRGNDDCADCFRYVLDVEIDGKRHHVQYDSTTPRLSEEDEVVRTLAAILRQALVEGTEQD